jgi:hypothetical protein
MNIESIIRKVLVEEFFNKKIIKEDRNTIGKTLKTLDGLRSQIEFLPRFTNQLKDLYKRDGKIDEKVFLKITSLVEMIYSSIDGEAEPGIFSKYLEDGEKMTLDELMDKSSAIIFRLTSTALGIMQEVKSNRYREAEKMLFDKLNPLSKTVMLYFDMIKEKNEEEDFESEENVSESFFRNIRIYEDIYGSVEQVNILQEAEYQGRKVQLGKIMQGDIKKFKVYVKNDKGKVVKVNFGFGGKSAKGKRMVIKKNNPERRRSFRARHNCDNPGPRWKPRYWACKTW